MLNDVYDKFCNASEHLAVDSQCTIQRESYF
jgi:hypothetical protein